MPLPAAANQHAKPLKDARWLELLKFDDGRSYSGSSFSSDSSPSSCRSSNPCRTPPMFDHCPSDSTPESGEDDSYGSDSDPPPPGRRAPRFRALPATAMPSPQPPMPSPVRSSPEPAEGLVPGPDTAACAAAAANLQALLQTAGSATAATDNLQALLRAWQNNPP